MANACNIEEVGADRRQLSNLEWLNSMTVAVENAKHILEAQELSGHFAQFVPAEVHPLKNPQTDVPRIARDPVLVRLIEDAIRRIPTSHTLHLGDSRHMSGLAKETVHLVLTSPPYWTLKEYRDSAGQLGHIGCYEEFLAELDKVWRHCFASLVPGGRLICVVGDVCLSRRKNNGRHTVVPLHASIQEHCRSIGYDNLAPIIWHKIANAAYEVENGSSFLGKPYEPNSVIKNDIEFILMERKPGGYRTPDLAIRKKWDLLVVSDGELLAGIEFKSQVGSFGNNYNNRTEEAIGSATDIWAAYREGAFKPSARPWLGYLMLLEEAPGSINPVRGREPHFKVFSEFRDASYAKRYEILLMKLVRERLYDAACFLMSNSQDGLSGIYREPASELSFQNFVASLAAKAVTAAKSRG